jgi:hypothetical protein
MSLQNLAKELSLAKHLKIVKELIKDVNTEKASEIVRNLEYKSENPIEGVIEKVNEIKLLFETSQFIEAELKVKQLFVFLARKIFSLLCDKTWNSLDVTDDKHVRFCQTCKRKVYEIQNEQELNFHLTAKNCIYYLGEGITTEACHIKQTGEERGYNFTGLMGTPNIVSENEDDGLPF